MNGLKKGLLALGIAVVAVVCIAWAAPKTKTEETKAEPKPDPEMVLATVEDQQIRRKDVDQLLQMMGPQGAMMYDNEQGRKNILDELISMKLFALQGAKEKLDEKPEFQEALARFREQTLARFAIEEVMKDVKVTDEEVQKFYEEHPEQFTRPESVHVRHILVSDDVTSADSLAKIEKDLASGVSFDEIARNVSLCPSKAQGGDLGQVTKGQMVPEFEKAAFALKNPGDVSEPVKTQFGWHLIRLEGRTPSKVEPLENVKPDLTKYLDGQKKTEAFKKAGEELRKVYKVTLAGAEDQKAPASGDEAPKN